ncbi:MAG: retron-type reverse transcriptase [Granulosicoccus sp.]|jgi:retron-type reverse transcriptase
MNTWAETKPFVISKRLVWDAYKRVKANSGAAGVDRQTMAEFEQSLVGNHYWIWNRLSSGSYFPLPVSVVAIPKKFSGKRIIGVPTVSDRIAQTAATLVLNPILEHHFHEDSSQKLRASISKPRSWSTHAAARGLLASSRATDGRSILHKEEAGRAMAARW